MRNAFSAFSAHRSKMLSLLKPCLFRERKERTSGLARKLISNIYSNTIRMQLKLRHLADRRKIKLNGSSRNTHKIFRIGKPHTGRLYGLMICACKCRHLRIFYYQALWHWASFFSTLSSQETAKRLEKNTKSRRIHLLLPLICKHCDVCISLWLSVPQEGRRYFNEFYVATKGWRIITIKKRIKRVSI